MIYNITIINMWLFLKLLLSRDRYVVSSRVSGIGDKFFQALNAWKYAQATGRILLIDWSRSKYLKDKSMNAFTYFCDCPDEIGGVKILKAEKIPFSFHVLALILQYGFLPLLTCAAARLLPLPILQRMENTVHQKKSESEIDLIKSKRPLKNKWVFFSSCLYFNQPEYDRSFFDHIKPNPKISTAIEDFSRLHFQRKKVIGIHIRYYASSLASSNFKPWWERREEILSYLVETLNPLIAQWEDSKYVIFLATNSEVIYHGLIEYFPQILTIPKTLEEENPTEELHLSGRQDPQTSLAAFMEYFLLARSDVLFRIPRSAFSYYSRLYAQEVWELEANVQNRLEFKKIN